MLDIWKLYLIKYAGVQIPDDQTNDITGAGMIISLHKPLAQKNQHSAGRMKVQNGPDSIQVGWIVSSLQNYFLSLFSKSISF